MSGWGNYNPNAQALAPGQGGYSGQQHWQGGWVGQQGGYGGQQGGYGRGGYQRQGGNQQGGYGGGYHQQQEQPAPLVYQQQGGYQQAGYQPGGYRGGDYQQQQQEQQVPLQPASVEKPAETSITDNSGPLKAKTIATVSAEGGSGGKARGNGSPKCGSPKASDAKEIIASLFPDLQAPKTEMNLSSLRRSHPDWDEDALVELVMKIDPFQRDLINGKNIGNESSLSVSSQRKHERKDNVTVLEYLKQQMRIPADSVHQFCGLQADRKFIIPSVSSLNSLDTQESPQADYFKDVFFAAHAVPWLLSDTFQDSHAEGSLYDTPEKRHQIISSELELDYFAEIYQGNYLDEARLTGNQENLDACQDAKMGRGVKSLLQYVGKQPSKKINNSRVSPEKDNKRVVLFEFGTDPKNGLYKLAQLEIRLAFWTAYQARKGRKCVPFYPEKNTTDSPNAIPPTPSATSTTAGGGKEGGEDRVVEVICGLVVPLTAHREIHRALEHQCPTNEKVYTFHNCRKYLCKVLSPGGKDLSSSSVGAAAKEAEYLVRVELPDKTEELPEKTKEEIVDISTAVRDGEVSPNISGLKKALKKELTDELQGIGVSRLIVYPPGKEKEELEGHIKLKDYPSDPDDKMTFFLCKVI